MSARAMPAMTRRIEGAVLNRRATTATTTRTAINSRSVWIVAVTGYTLAWPRHSSFQDRPRPIGRREGRPCDCAPRRSDHQEGQKLTQRHEGAMSALPPKADISLRRSDVHLVRRIQPIDATPFHSNLARWNGMHME